MVAMKIATLLLALAVFVTLVHGRFVEVPFGTSDTTASPSGALHRPNNAVDIGNGTSINDKQPFQIAAIDWDPHNIATDDSWQKFNKKGNMFYCLMDMPDDVAGKKWPDPYKRTPPTASSPWKGTLEGKFPISSFNV